MTITDRTGRTDPGLTDQIAERLTAIRVQRFIVQNDPAPLTAIESVLIYVNRCENAGITMVPADVRRLIARALGEGS